jgi:GMC oxidoreductase
VTSIEYELLPGTRSLDELANPEKLAEAMAQYQAGLSSILSSSFTHCAMLPLSKIMPQSELDTLIQTLQKDLETSTNPRDRLLFQIELEHMKNDDASLGSVEFVPAPFGFCIYQTGKDVPGSGRQYMSFFVMGLHPHSRGSIHISSPNITDHPAIEPNVYSSPVDPHIMLRGIQVADKFSRSSPLAKFLGKRVLPPEGELTEEGWNKHILETTSTCYHTIGTCSMLPREKGGVVDSRLRVHGVKGLRVVDASVLPLHISHHIQATVYAVAEQAADFIKEGWKD